MCLHMINLLFLGCSLSAGMWKKTPQKPRIRADSHLNQNSFLTFCTKWLALMRCTWCQDTALRTEVPRWEDREGGDLATSRSSSRSSSPVIDGYHRETFCVPEKVKVFFRLFTSWHCIQMLFNDDNRWLVLSDRPWVWKRKFRAMTGVMYEFWHKSANHLSKTCSTKRRRTRSVSFDKIWLTFKQMSYVQYFLKQ